MKLHGTFLLCLVCGALGASVPSGEQPKSSGYLEKLIDYRRSLLEFNWKIDESKYNLNQNLRGLLNGCKEGDLDIPAIEEKLQNLRSTYASQIAEYRDTLNSIYNADIGPQFKLAEEHKQNIEANLKKAEANFDNGISELSLSLEKLKLNAVKLKADSDSSSNTGSSWFPSWSSFYQTVIDYFPTITNNEYVQNVQNTFSNLANNVTSIFNQNQGNQVINNNSNNKPGTDGSASGSDNSGSSSNTDNSGTDNSGTDNSGTDNSGSDNSGTDNSGSGYSDNADHVDPNRLVTKLPTPEAPSLELLHGN